jgi:hypothetical protein
VHAVDQGKPFVIKARADIGRLSPIHPKTMSKVLNEPFQIGK